MNQDEVDLMKSNEDDWDLLDQTISKKIENIPDNPTEEQVIPVESALDEVDDYVDDSYNNILKEKISGSSKNLEEQNEKSTILSEEVETSMNLDDEKLLDLDDALLEEAKLAEAEIESGLNAEMLEEMASLDDFFATSEEITEEVQNNEEYGEPMETSVPTEELDGIIGDSNDTDFSLEEFDALLGDSLDSEKMQTKSASDIFSDSLGAVSSLDDEALEEQFNNLLPDEEKVVETKKNKKKTLMDKMFANIEPENPEEEIEKEKQRIAELEEKKKQKEEAKQKQKEEKKKAAAEKKAAKNEAKAAAKEAKAKKKAEAREKKQKEREEAERNYVPEGKINKIGASIVFSTAAVIGIAIIVVTLKGTYGLTVSNADFNSTIGRYDAAYQELSGLKLKAKDEELYNKVETVMRMEKQQNSYENFKELNMHVEALDSLLKGLERYDEYYADASKYGVANEYDSLRKEMISELKQVYNVSESEAKELIKQKDKVEYTKALTRICNAAPKASSNGDAVASVNE